MLLIDMKSLLTAIETSIFLMDKPDTPDNLLCLFFTGGADPSHAFDSKQFEEPSFQVIVRNTSALTAFSKAEAVKDALDGRTGLTIGSTKYISIFSQGDILQLGKDEKNRTELSLNFRVKLKR